MHERQQEVVRNYQNRIESLNKSLLVNQGLGSRFSYIRLGIFLAAIPVIVFMTSIGYVAVILAVVIALIAFVQAVLYQQKYDKLAQKFENLIQINENEIQAVQNFENSYYDGEAYEEAHHYYTGDLDIFGPNSLFALINRASTFDGVENLRKLFLEKAEPESLDLRREAIQEMESKVEWRQEFANALYDIEGGHKRNLGAEIDEELDLELGFADGPFISNYRKAVPFIWLAIIVLFFVAFDAASTLATVVFFFNLILTIRKAKETTRVQVRLSAASIMLRSYINAIDIIFKETWNAKLLSERVRHFQSDSATRQTVEVLSKLKQIIDHLDYRLNLIPAIVLNGLILWDFRTISRLAKWKDDHKGKVAELFEFVGMLEAYASLSNWAYNHPHYTYSEISNDYFSLSATNIKHPLIQEDENVGNDFIIKKGDHLSIITGSNMSGKSTLLRTIGVNMILGYTGTRVAADYFSFPFVFVISYMRIKDILEESVSTFKAELNRIEMILNVLKTGEQCFILIDEMLRGTNSKDKLTGSIGIAKRLLAEQTYAMIATHDIKLAELGNEISEGVANYYFDIDYKDGDLLFDYKVKEGICENFNASFLLKQLGIEMEE